jgi:hypothetical protein
MSALCLYLEPMPAAAGHSRVGAWTFGITNDTPRGH